MNAGWLELPRSSSGSDYLTGTYYDSDGATRNYSYLYDKSMYTSMWIAYPLSASDLSGTQATSNGWSAADGIPASDQINVWNASYNVIYGQTAYVDNASTASEYYARGHQIPDADRQYNKTMLPQTYYAINSTPQIQNKFNGGIWQELEKAVRAVAQSSSDVVYVATGPAFVRADGAGTETVTRITPKGDPTKTCPVPNYYWKVLLKVKKSGDTITKACTIGFWFVHQQYNDSSAYADHAVSVNEIERRTDLDLFANLPDDLEDDAEANTSWTTFQSF